MADITSITPLAEAQRHLIEAKIAHDFEIAFAALDQIALPPAHHWQPGKAALSWHGRDIIRSTLNGASIHARPATDDPRTGFHAEAWLFWNSRATARPSLHHLRAILWASQGPATSRTARPLLAGEACYLSGETIAQIVCGLCRQLDAALARYADTRQFA